MKKLFGIFFLGGLISCGYSQAANSAADDLFMTGVWKIISYQMVGYPAWSEADAQNWVGKLVEFTSRSKKATLRDSTGVQKICSEFSYQVTKQNAEGYFLVGYKQAPARFGVTDSEIEVATLSCKNESWLGKSREFVKISEQLALSNWDGIFFYFAKQADSFSLLSTQGIFKILMITPQSVGILTPASDFNETTLYRALPGYKILEVNHISDDNIKIIDRFELFRQDKLKLKVYPHATNPLKIGSIEIEDELAYAPANTKIGAIYTEVFKDDQQTADCQAGIKNFSGKTLCSFKNMNSVQYIFRPRENTGGTVSPIEALNEAILIGFIWVADPALITESSPKNLSQEPPSMMTTSLSSSTTMAVAPPPAMAMSTSPASLSAPPINNLTVLSNTSSTMTAVTPMAAGDSSLPTSSGGGTVPVPLDHETAYKLQDYQLNQIYNQLKDSLIHLEATGSKAAGPINSTNLLDAQKAWLYYRDKNCAWQSNLQNQKVNDDTYICLERITLDRANELVQLLKIIGKQ